jgi:Tfp pilus assembly protein PilN
MAKIDDIKNWVELELSDVRDYVRKKNRTWLIAAGVGVVLVIVLLFTVFKRKDSTNADARIEVLQEQIDNLKRSNVFLDSMIKEQDTLLIINNQKEIKIKERHDKEPTRVPNLTKDQLRSEVTNFPD